MARQETISVMHAHHYLVFYPVLAALAVLPLAAGTRALARDGFARELRVVWASAAVSLAGTLVLFLYAMDWGRWIYLHVFSIGILLLFLDRKPRKLPAYSSDPIAATPGRSRLGYALLLAAYATTWSLPRYHTGDPPYRFGYFGLVHHVLFDRHSIKQGSQR